MCMCMCVIFFHIVHYSPYLVCLSDTRNLRVETYHFLLAILTGGSLLNFWQELSVVRVLNVHSFHE